MTAITKYFVGGEREAFIAGTGSSLAWTTTAGHYDADFSRGAVRLPVNGNTAYIDTPLSSPQNECYVGLMHYMESPLGGSPNPSNTAWFLFINASLVGLYRVMGIGGTITQPLLQWQYWNGTAWTAAGPGFVVPTDIIHKWDFQFKADPAAGFARAYVDGVLLGELTGDTELVTPYAISNMRVMTCGSSSNNTAGTPNISEVQILDVSTLGRRLATLAITAAGASNTFATGTYADIDEAGIYSDTDFMASTTSAQQYSCVTSDLSTAAQSYLVDGVVIAYRLQKGGSGPQNLKGLVRIGGVDYFSSASVPAIVTAFGYSWADFPQNPATSANFTPTEINTVGFETGAQSQP